MKDKKNGIIKPEGAREKRVWMTLSGDFKKRGSALLHQQCWCFGFDVRHQVNGQRANLLVEMGFERTPPPADYKGATMYQKREDDGSTITLWGFGLCFGDERGGIFVSRFSFWPRWGEVAAPERAHATEQLGDFRAARRLHECEHALDYFARALSWIARYERQIALVAGEGHRENTLKQWGHVVSPASDIAQRWEDLALQSPSNARFWKRENNRTHEIERPLQGSFMKVSG